MTPLLLFLILAYLLPGQTLFAWNEDYSPEKLRGEQAVCVRLTASPLGKRWNVRSSLTEIPCLEEENPSTLLWGEKPLDSFALVPKDFRAYQQMPWKTTLQKLKNPSKALWQFHCLAASPLEILGVQTKHWSYRGEVASATDFQNCEAAQVSAFNICKNILGGEELLESCKAEVETFSQPLNPAKTVKPLDNLMESWVCVEQNKQGAGRLNFKIRESSEHCLSAEDSMRLKSDSTGLLLFTPAHTQLENTSRH